MRASAASSREVQRRTIVGEDFLRLHEVKKLTKLGPIHLPISTPFRGSVASSGGYLRFSINRPSVDGQLTEDSGTWVSIYGRAWVKHVSHNISSIDFALLNIIKDTPKE